ncbi:glycerate kinase [Nocardia yamanashiensis]|uniref:glycerate kinase n=1 Tax=Nocardia yamanashiensis TaxID=209247 RepID=UPI001E61F625|nr:glycerate kinase [Nocardia yamanashiensis]UGT40688.1 glycerate kinase [Nocardia yamanashiensis]
MTTAPARRIILAPDKFKGSLTAAQVASALAAGITRTAPGAEIRQLPIADGGDGTVDAFLAAGWKNEPLSAPGPTVEPVSTAYAYLPPSPGAVLGRPPHHSDAEPGTPAGEFPGASPASGTSPKVSGASAGECEVNPAAAGGEGGSDDHTRGGTAVVELAAVVGLVKLPGGQLDPLHSSTYGLGVVIAHALDRGVRDIVLGLGGSASTDGGAGLLQALGLRIFDADDRELPHGGAELSRAVRVDRTHLHPALAATRFTLASDVDNPLLGPDGAAAVYGPQKGASPEQVTNLDAALANWAKLIGPEWAEQPGAGAAGGTGFGAMAVLGATARSGIDVVLDLIDFPAQVDGADLVVTGEGSFDAQSLNGKAPVGVAAAAHRAGVPVTVVAGRVGLTPDQVRAAGFSDAYALSDLEPDPARSIANAAVLLERIGAAIGERLAG